MEDRMTIKQVSQLAKEERDEWLRIAKERNGWLAIAGWKVTRAQALLKRNQGCGGPNMTGARDGGDLGGDEAFHSRLTQHFGVRWKDYRLPASRCLIRQAGYRPRVPFPAGPHCRSDSIA